MQKSCGSCKNWIKIKSMKGLCDRFDYGWCNSDYGAGCASFKRKKHKRIRIKVIESGE